MRPFPGQPIPSYSLTINAISERFISRETACIHAGSAGCSSRQTPAGFPVPTRSAKASTQKRVGRRIILITGTYEPMPGSDKSACPLFRPALRTRFISLMTGSSEGGIAVSSVIDRLTLVTDAVLQKISTPAAGRIVPLKHRELCSIKYRRDLFKIGLVEQDLSAGCPA